MRLGKRKAGRRQPQAEVIQLHPLLTLAQNAVNEFDELRTKFLAEEALWQEEHPEAHEALAALEEIRDKLNTARDVAKHHVKEAGRTVGDFVYREKKKSPFYDGEKLLEHLLTLEPHSFKETVRILKERGVIQSLVLDKEAAKTVHQRSSEEGLSQIVGESFNEGGQPLAPAITVPKF